MSSSNGFFPLIGNRQIFANNLLGQYQQETSALVILHFHSISYSVKPS